jgi:hypothetical protein
MIYGMTLAGAIHTVLAISGIAVGMLQFVRPKRGPPHRARGYRPHLSSQPDANDSMIPQDAAPS